MTNESTDNTSSCGPCSGEVTECSKDTGVLGARLSGIKRKLLVLSGKGGVGKSTFAVNLAVSLAKEGNKVGLLDIDIHGPSVPKLLGLDNGSLNIIGNNILPVRSDGDLKVVSIGFLLKDRDDAVIWRGPMKHGVIKQFLEEVDWGELDYLVVDCPPGTGDEPLSLIQLMADGKTSSSQDEGAIIVTTPQELALADVRKSVNFCKTLNLNIVGVVENMSGLVCPHCGEMVEVFAAGGGEKMAHDVRDLRRKPFRTLGIPADMSNIPNLRP
ncbi:P-loop NTPase [Candidatus Hydrogenedentota bacterium]